MKVRARSTTNILGLKRLVRDLDLHTVCEEAGCPNIYECWSDRTATFMILGDRCTRACGFCLVDTRKPLAVDVDEPRRVADAVVALGLAHVVITCVARDDLPDGGASIFAATVDAVRAASPQTAVELLISDVAGDDVSLATIFAARPDVLNHNLETVARLQRAARPSAGYARSLSVLARAKDAGLVTKSGLILGMGETADEVRSALGDLRAVGVDIVTLGQYLRPTAQHLPGRPLVDTRRLRRDPSRRAGDRLRARGGGTARAVELPRPRGNRSVGDSRGLRYWGPWPNGSPPSPTTSRSGGCEQPLFFVATAPGGSDGHVNLSPKGLDTLRVLDPDPRRVSRPHRAAASRRSPTCATTGASR